MNEIETANRLADLYVSYRQRYIEARNNHGKPAIYVPRLHGEEKPLNNGMLQSHALQRVAVGVFAGPLSSKFITLNISHHDPETVRKVMQGLEDVGFLHDDIHISTSGREGYHVEIFFNNLMYTNDLLKFYGTVIEAQKLDRRKVEFRPTHGQAIILPLSRHPKTGNICWFLNRDTLEPIESADYLLTIHPVEHDRAMELIRERCCTVEDAEPA